jgi:hypothetical protein
MLHYKSIIEPQHLGHVLEEIIPNMLILGLWIDYDFAHVSVLSAFHWNTILCRLSIGKVLGMMAMTKFLTS